MPLIETAGSVATMGFSVLEELGYKTIVLFGQDLGFENANCSHAIGSTSKLNESGPLLKVCSNNNETIYTTPDFLLF